MSQPLLPTTATPRSGSTLAASPQGPASAPLFAQALIASAQTTPHMISASGATTILATPAVQIQDKADIATDMAPHGPITMEPERPQGALLARPMAAAASSLMLTPWADVPARTDGHPQKHAPSDHAGNLPTAAETVEQVLAPMPNPIIVPPQPSAPPMALVSNTAGALNAVTPGNSNTRQAMPAPALSVAQLASSSISAQSITLQSPSLHGVPASAVAPQATRTASDSDNGKGASASEPQSRQSPPAKVAQFEPVRGLAPGHEPKLTSSVATVEPSCLEGSQAKQLVVPQRPTATATQLTGTVAIPLLGNPQPIAELGPTPTSEPNTPSLTVSSVRQASGIITGSNASPTGTGETTTAVTQEPGAKSALISHAAMSAPNTNDPHSGNTDSDEPDSSHKDAGGPMSVRLETGTEAASPEAPAMVASAIAPPLSTTSSPTSTIATPTEQIAHVLAEATKATGATLEQTPPGVGFAITARVPSSVSVSLSPKELGMVNIQIDRPAGAPATVTLTAERPETLALLQRDHVQLNRALDQAGVAPEGRLLAFHLSSQPSGTQGSAWQSPNQSFDAASSGSGDSPSWQPPSSDSRQPQSQHSQRAGREDANFRQSMPDPVIAARLIASDRINITA